MMSANIHLFNTTMHSEIRILEMSSDKELVVLDIGAQYSDKVSVFLTREQAKTLREILRGVDDHDKL
jgi:hypothetical protein